MKKEKMSVEQWGMIWDTYKKDFAGVPKKQRWELLSDLVNFMAVEIVNSEIECRALNRQKITACKTFLFELFRKEIEQAQEKKFSVDAFFDFLQRAEFHSARVSK